MKPTYEIARVSVMCVTEEEAAIIASECLNSKFVVSARIFPTRTLSRDVEGLSDRIEYVLEMDTIPQRVGSIETTIRARHSSEMPEVISYNVSVPDVRYVRHVRAATASGNSMIDI